MVREIVQRAWCDLHMLRDERVEMSETHAVSLDGTAYTLDLCPEHVGDFERFAELVRTGSARVPTTPTTKNNRPETAQGSTAAKFSNHERVCLACGHVSTSQAGYKDHIKRVHGGATIGDVYGTRCPLCGRPCDTIQALGVHSSRTHADDGVRDVATLFVIASQRGDAHGVVSERLAAVANMPGAVPGRVLPLPAAVERRAS